MTAAEPSLPLPAAEPGGGGRVIRPVPPQAGFDPRDATDRQLIELGLPPQPDPDRNPRLHALWCRLLLPSPRFFRPELELLPAPAANVETRRGTPLSPGRWGGSENWAGALVTARDNARFVTATASWTVPTPKLPPGASFSQLPVNEAWRASFWVGLDGHRRGSRSMPQLGTTVAIEGGRVPPLYEAYAWVQWWVRDQRFGEIRLADFVVQPGDRIVAWLTVLSPVAVLFNFRNLGQPDEAGRVPPTVEMPGGILWTKDSPDVAADPARGDRSMAPVEGSAACFVAERPLSMPPPLAKVADILYPMPDFGTVSFEDCCAESRDADDPEAPSIARDLAAARMIRMTEVTEESGARSRVIATPCRPPEGRDGLMVRYLPP